MQPLLTWPMWRGALGVCGRSDVAVGAGGGGTLWHRAQPLTIVGFGVRLCPSGVAIGLLQARSCRRVALWTRHEVCWKETIRVSSFGCSWVLGEADWLADQLSRWYMMILQSALLDERCDTVSLRKQRRVGNRDSNLGARNEMATFHDQLAMPAAIPLAVSMLK